MVYKLRLDFPEAAYHRINRGNDRTWIFDQARTKSAFEACIFEACEVQLSLYAASTVPVSSRAANNSEYSERPLRIPCGK